MTTQLDLGWNAAFLQEKIAEATKVIQDCSLKTGDKPLIIQFSGGNDSMTLLQLVRDAGVTNFCCGYMATGTELPGVVTFVRNFCKENGIRVLVSHPGLHKGNIFQRIDRFKSFPNLGSFDGGGKRLWCCRDLKLRPQKKLINATFGKGTYYRLEGIRRFESARRKNIYRQYVETFMRPDDEFKGSWEVYPILNWSDDDVKKYIELKKLPVLKLYKEFGVSGCSWCPFYSPELYAGVIRQLPDWGIYKRIIEWEEKLNIPSVQGGVFLRDIKQAVLEGTPIPVSNKNNKKKSPCMIEWEGKMVPTCSIYGHLFLGGHCFRCGLEEK
jgi:3'-phosphoadenosine 5'-phosphosulfate sulfotransferase (PAPS reductase)/FAD synthetase